MDREHDIIDCIGSYDKLSADISSALGDPADSLMLALAESYARILLVPAGSALGVALKLGCIARHYAGGDVPVEDVARVAEELMAVAG